MCGICGLATRESGAPVDEAVVRRMAAALVHRGPDGEGAHVDRGIGLGVRRLAIVDLETGDQPIANEDGTVVVVCNGEIYNHIELRAELERAGHRFRTRSDVETIAHLYEDHGTDFLHRLRGMFALALWDARRRRLVLARDRLGIKPLVWAPTREGIAFASEAKALLAGGCIEAALDPAALDEVLLWGWIPTPGSAFAGVSRLPPGHLLVWEEGRHDVRPWWTLPFVEERERPALSDEEWAEGLLARLEDAVRIHLRADVPVGAWLSGGIDSSSVAALAARILGRTIDAFSLEFSDPGYNEVGTTRTLDTFPGSGVRGHRARYTDDDFALLPRCVWHGEEPVGRGFGSVRQRISALTAEHAKVALAGEGADEMLGGYWWYKADRRMRLVSQLIGGRERALRRPPRSEGVERAIRLAHAPATPDVARFLAAVGPLGSERRGSLLAPEIARAIERNPRELPQTPPWLPRLHPVDWLQYWDLTTRMHDFIVLTLDRHSMAESVEIRVPFLDHEVAQWCLAMPPRLKQSRPEKSVLRRAMAGDLPREIVDRPKRGLGGPSSRWFRGRLPDFAEDLLSEANLSRTGWFDPRRVAEIRAIHAAGKANRSEQLLAVLQFQVWDEIFLRGTDFASLVAEAAA